MERAAVGLWIRRLRLHLQLSQVEFASRIGVSNVTVSRWECGHVLPGTTAMARLHQLDERLPVSDGSHGSLAQGNLPQPVTAFFGREHELARLMHHATHNQIVTLVGPAGVGKTRLSLELGRRWAHRFENGVWLVDLARVTTAEAVPEVAARSLQVRSVVATRLLDRIGAALANRSMLVIVDNCEHLRPAAKTLIETLARSSRVHVLATSRIPLDLPGEWVEGIRPLPHERAVDLFLDRSETESDASNAIETICRRLDGLPLAIELAAARSALLSPGQIVKRLDRRFSLLSEARGERGFSLHAAIAWSYDLLSSEEQIVFRRVSVFAGSFDIDAAEAVCTNSDISASKVVDAIGELVRQSLIVSAGSAGQTGTNRFRMLETIRAFAHEQLVEAGELDAVASQQARYLGDVAYTATAAFGGPAHPMALTTIEQEMDNLLAAIELTGRLGLANDALRLCVALWPAWNIMGLFAEGAERLESVLARAGNNQANSVVAEALIGSGTLHARLAALVVARARAQEALELWSSLGVPRGQARALDLLGLIEQRSGHVENAHAQHERALQIWRAQNDSTGAARSLTALGQLANVRGDRTLAEQLYTEAWEQSRGSADLDLETTLLLDLGELAGRTGQYAQSVGFFERALAASEQLADPDRTAAIIANLAEVRVQTGNPARAMAEASDAVARYRSLGNRSHLADALYILATAQIATGENAAGLTALREALAIYAELGNDIYIAETVQAIVDVANRLGASRAAARWLGASAAIQERAGVAPYAHFDFAGVREAIETALGTALLEEEMATGASMSVSQLVFDVLHHAEPLAPPASEPQNSPRSPGLTARQLDVLRLVVDGYSNRQIAERLQISERTVERHLSSTYSALDVERRSAAVAAAIALGLTGDATP